MVKLPKGTKVILKGQTFELVKDTEVTVDAETVEQTAEILAAAGILEANGNLRREEVIDGKKCVVDYIGTGKKRVTEIK